MSKPRPCLRCMGVPMLQVSVIALVYLCVWGTWQDCQAESQNAAAASMASATTRRVTDPAYPTTQLANSSLTADIYLPDAERGYYRGPRFDRSGLIARVSCNGHVFFGPWHSRHDPLGHDNVLGPAEEFGMTRPLGYDEAKPGETFIKIGVGHLLRGDAEDYAFYKDYQVVKAEPWTVLRTDDSIEFRQRLSDPRGWGYDYLKRVRLIAGQPELVIEHHLANTGKRTIHTDQYCHNFILIDDLPVDAAYRVRLPFNATPVEPQKLRDIAVVKGHEIVFTGPVCADQSLWTPLAGLGATPQDYAFTVENRLSGSAVAVSGDIAPSKMDFYATVRAVCVEPFVDLNLEPGGDVTWNVRYRFITRLPTTKH